MPIIHWPETDRPREKLLANGAHNLTDSELIAIILNTGTRSMSALDLAKSLLAEQGGIKYLIDQSQRIKGIGEAKQAALRAAVEIGRRYLATQIKKGEKLNGSQRAQAFLAGRLRHLDREVFACIYLDSHLRLIHFEELFLGSLHEASVYPREIVRQSLRHNAAKVILAHNHPSGIPTPSTADRDVTRIIKQALALVEIEVIDHVIVGSEACYSFAENGWA